MIEKCETRYKKQTAIKRNVNSQANKWRNGKISEKKKICYSWNKYTPRWVWVFALNSEKRSSFCSWRLSVESELFPEVISLWVSLFTGEKSTNGRTSPFLDSLCHDWKPILIARKPLSRFPAGRSVGRPVDRSAGLNQGLNLKNFGQRSGEWMYLYCPCLYK